MRRKLAAQQAHAVPASACSTASAERRQLDAGRCVTDIPAAVGSAMTSPVELLDSPRSAAAVAARSDAPVRTRTTLIEERFRARAGGRDDVVITELLLPCGTLDPELVNRALPSLARALPMLTARFESPAPWAFKTHAHVTGRLDDEDVVHVHAANTDLDALHVQLTERHGPIENNKLWSFHFIPGSRSDCLLIAAHHIVCDGPSLARLLGTLMYLVQGGELPPGPDIDTLARERHAVVDAAIDYGGDTGLQRSSRDACGFPIRYPDAGWGALGYAKVEVAPVAARARRLGVSVNEYALAAVAITSARWITETSGRPPESSIVIRFPVNLRPSHDPVMGFGNTVGYADTLTAPFDATVGEVLAQVRTSMEQQSAVLSRTQQRRFPVPAYARLLDVVPAALRTGAFSLGSGRDPSAWLSNVGRVDNEMTRQTLGLRGGMLRRSPSPPLILLAGFGDSLHLTGSLPAGVANEQESAMFFQMFAGICETGE